MSIKSPIPHVSLVDSLSWQEILANTVRDTETLRQLLEIDRLSLPDNHPLLQRFPVRVPTPYLARIRKGDPRDPLLLQVFPDAAEAADVPGYVTDPLLESESNPKPGILHKYDGRALLVATSSCAIHCRYCFRRHFPYTDNHSGKQGWKESLEYIRADSSIREIIFSGGDPLTLPDSYLAWFLDELDNISHVTRIRFHSRLPIMIPQRITTAFCELLANSRFQTILVIHSNHAQELDEEVDLACRRLKSSGVTLLNQSVLLRGINDDAHVLAELSERLFSVGILPYYLHLMDPVSGTAHFNVDTPEATKLLGDLQGVLPGYLVPKLVREEPGKPSKTSIV